MKIKVCPDCGSPEIEYASMAAAARTVRGFGLPEVYYCQKCGYEGPLIIEAEKKYLADIKFKKVPVKYEPLHPIHAERYKPIFMICVLLFFMVSVFFFFPKTAPAAAPEFFEFQGQKIIISFGELDLLRLLGSTQTLPFVGSVTFEKSSGVGVLEYRISNTTVLDIGRATGLSGMIGFVFPVFIVFLLIALIVVMLHSHWRRAVHFGR